MSEQGGCAEETIGAGLRLIGGDACDLGEAWWDQHEVTVKKGFLKSPGCTNKGKSFKISEKSDVILSHPGRPDNKNP